MKQGTESMITAATRGHISGPLRFVAAVAATLFTAGFTIAQSPPVAQPLAPREVSPAANKPGVTVSATKQFVIHGADLNTRSAFSMMSEETSLSLGRLLRDDARYVIPVVVVLKTPPDVSMADPTVFTYVDQLVPSGFHLQMNVQLRADFRTEDYTRELVRVLLAERILRNHEKLNTTRERVLPDWTLTGIMQALEFRGRTRPSAVFSAVFRSGQIYSVDRILAADPAGMDALSRTIFETSSCALVLSLLDQPEGALRFSHFLSALATGSQTDRELLEHYFPGLGVSRNSLEKWWTLQLASLATPTALETMSVGDTEEALDKALTLRFKAEKDPEKESPKPEKSKDEPKTESRGFFRFFGGAKKDENKDATTSAAKSKDQDTVKSADKPKSDDKPKAEPSSEKGKGTEKKDADPKKDSDAPEEANPEKKSFFHLPTLSNPLGRKIFFPFSKKKTEDADESDSDKEEAAKKKNKDDAASKAAKTKSAPESDKKETDKKSAQKSDEKKGTEPAKKSREELAKPESPITQPNKIPRKPSAERKISGRPEELLKEEPAKAEKKAAPKRDDESEKQAESGHRSVFNPLNWFRKTPEPKVGDLALKKLKDDASAQDEPPKKVTREGVPIAEFRTIWKRDDRSAILTNSLQQLNALKLRSHPLYKGVIAEYSAVIEQLIRGKDRGAADKLEKLAQQRRKVHEGAAAVESFVDFHVASQSQGYSGMFDDYLRLCRKLDEEVHPRTDAISKYLDAIEKEFE